ncbi:MAG: hypothetical protein ACE5EH_02620 [Gammaproteobacteria bacterium]
MTHLRKNVLTQQYKWYPEMMPIPALGQCSRLYANCCIHDVQIGSIPICHATDRIIYGFCSKAASKLSGVRHHPGSLVKYSG